MLKHQKKLLFFIFGSLFLSLFIIPINLCAVDREVYEDIKSGNLKNAMDVIKQEKFKDISDYYFDNGDTALHIAAKYNNSQAIALFIKMHADVNKKNDLGQTPLYTAAKYKKEGATRTLLAFGANPSLAAKNGDFPLLAAVISKSYNCTLILLQNGANPNQQIKNHWTPLHFAAITGSDSITLLLIHYNANLATKAFYTPRFTFLGNVNSIFGTNNIIGGWTPLHVAILAGSLKVIYAIYKKSPLSFNDATNDGQFPIHLAVLTHNLTMIRLFKNLGTDINKQDINGNSPTMLATLNNDVKIVRYLLSSGANPVTRNNTGVNGRDLAKSIGSPELVHIYDQYYGVINHTSPYSKDVPKTPPTKAALAQAHDIAYPKDSNEPPAASNNSMIQIKPGEADIMSNDPNLYDPETDEYGSDKDDDD